MKKIILAIVLAFVSVSLVHAAAETKKVCEKTKDAKTGKDKEVCKQVKIHKKLDGEKLPEKK
jgi:hypothetical protein